MLELKHIQKRYQYTKVLDDISMSLPDVGLVAIVGPSGCGKSTLLNIIGGIDCDFFGDIVYDNESVKKHLSRYRRKHISYIFQQLNLIMWLNVQQNIKLPHFFHKQSINHNINILEIPEKKLSYLSLGQRQRVALLRACFHQKDILLCDEPTGSLDPSNARKVIELLKEESQERLVIIVTHDYHSIQELSDEIYEMKDGKIIHHQVNNHTCQVLKKKMDSKKLLFPYIRLSFASLKSHKKRTLQLVFGLSLSLICILLTLTMSKSLEEQINQYVYSLIPPSSITIQSQNESFSIDNIQQLKNQEEITRIQLFLDDYELLGVGFVGERYQESQTLFIGDDTSPYDSLPLKYGHLPQENYEVIVSLSTAEHLCQENDVSDLIGKKIYAWYKHELEVKAIEYCVVGVTSQMTSMDTLYQRENAYIELLQQRDQWQEVNCHLGIIFVDQNEQRSEVYKQLKHYFPQYQFIETGVSTTKHISSTMKQIKIVLFVFSLLAILSSLFLIGEVMFLNVVQKKKDFAIMKCFGANTLSLIKLVLCESFQIVIYSLIFVYLIYYQMISFLNVFLKEVLINETIILSVDYQLLTIVCVFSIILMFISQFVSLVYIMKLNTVETLKS